MTTNEKVMNYLKKKYPLEKNTTDKPINIHIRFLNILDLQMKQFFFQQYYYIQ